MILRRMMRFFLVQWYKASAELYGAPKGTWTLESAVCLSNGQYGPHEEGDDPVEHYRLLIRCMMEYFPTRFPTGLKWVQPQVLNGDGHDWWNTLLPAYGYEEHTNSAA